MANLNNRKLSDMWKEVLSILPNALVTEDISGEIVIYTGLTVGECGCIFEHDRDAWSYWNQGVDDGHGCRGCGINVPFGRGHYPKGTDDRVCADCHEEDN